MPTPFRTSVRPVLMLSTGLIAACLAGPATAERRDCSVTKQSKQELSRTVSQPSNIAGHEMFQAVRLDAQTSANPDFNGVDQLVFVQVDQVYGTGDHRGHSINLHRNGDRSYARWSGVHKTVAIDGGGWETTIDGKYEFVGGTGKFASIKGGGTYRGKLTPEGLVEQDTCQADY